MLSSTSSQHKPNMADVRDVRIIGNQEDLAIQSNATKPPLVAAEPLQSINVIIDGRHRLAGGDAGETPYDFSVDINHNLFRARSIEVSKVGIARPPNITQHNQNLVIVAETWPKNVAQFESNNGGQGWAGEANNAVGVDGPIYYAFTVQLRTGFYSLQQFIDSFQTSLNFASSVASAPDGYHRAAVHPVVFTVTWKAEKQQLYITVERNGTNPILYPKIAFCSFSDQDILDYNFLYRGTNFAPFRHYVNFPGQMNQFTDLHASQYVGVLATDPTSLLSTYLGHTHLSGIVGLMYTRYAILNSETFCLYSITDSRASHPALYGDVVALVDLVDFSNHVHNNASGTASHNGNFKFIEIPDAPRVNIANSQRNLHNIISSYVIDEWGMSYESLFDMDTYAPEESVIVPTEGNMPCACIYFCKVWF